MEKVYMFTKIFKMKKHITNKLNIQEIYKKLKYNIKNT